MLPSFVTVSHTIWILNCGTTHVLYIVVVNCSLLISNIARNVRIDQVDIKWRITMLCFDVAVH